MTSTIIKHYPLSINHQVENQLDLLVLDGSDGHVVGSHIVYKIDACRIISAVGEESETPSCYHAFVNAITALFGSAWCGATVRCPVASHFIKSEWSSLEAVSGIKVISIDSCQRHDDAVAIGADDFKPLDVAPSLQFPLAQLAQFLGLVNSG